MAETMRSGPGLPRRDFPLRLGGGLLAMFDGMRRASAQQAPPAPTRRVVPGAAAEPAAPGRIAGAPGRRLALLLGNNGYQKAPPLRNAVHDAQDLGAELKKLGFDATVVLDSGLAAAGAAIGTFATKVRPGDVAFFFYSGHGLQANGENYIVPVDFDPSKGDADLNRRCVRATSVRENLEKAGAQLCVVVLDACRDNPFRPGAPVKGMALMEPGLGTAIALATGPGRTASDNPGERNGLFTKHLLQRIGKPGPDLETMFKQVKDAVYADSNGQQRPWTFADVVGQFYFAPVPGGFSPPAEAAAYLEAGKRAFQSGKFEEAAANFERGLRIDPENPFTYNALGASKARLRQWSVALGWYSKAIEKKPDYASAYFNRGVAYYGAARYDLALQDFTWAVDQEPSDPLALNLRGKTHLALRNVDDALADFNHALELDPSDATAMAGRGTVAFRQGHYPEALRDLTSAIAIRPLPETFDQRSQVYRALHRTAEADNDTRQADQLRAQH